MNANTEAKLVKTYKNKGAATVVMKSLIKAAGDNAPEFEVIEVDGGYMVAIVAPKVPAKEPTARKGHGLPTYIAKAVKELRAKFADVPAHVETVRAGKKINIMINDEKVFWVYKQEVADKMVAALVH